MADPGSHIEAGDILVTGTEILVGRSARTNARGIAEMTQLAAAFAVRFNDRVPMATGFPASRGRIAAAGHALREIDNSACARQDGGISRLSLRLSPPPR